MRIPFVDLYAQYLTIKPEIDAAMAAVIRDSAYVRGPQVEKFEQAWAAALGVDHCVSCANGTDAIYIAMRGLGLKPGDEVITTAHSWISTSETITQAGGRVVFCDTQPDTFTIDPALIEAKITPRTVGVIPVHLYGQPADMDPILAIARKHNLWIIEDCAQAHLARYKGQLVGTFGHAATFSFYPGKNLGAYGDAGALVTNDPNLADWCATYARHGGKGEHTMEGINSRLDGLQAAILNVKLPHLQKWTEARQRLAAQYSALLAERPGLTTPPTAPDRSHVFHLYVVRIPSPAGSGSPSAARDAVQKHLKDNGISTSLNYPKALPFYPAYTYLGHSPQDFPVAHRHQSEILSLPLYPEMTEEMLHSVADSLRIALAPSDTLIAAH
ncbi:MAG: DegT/DnrJ/EryC1/StrS family aminotransferase [Verrucomicrobiales bacterium]